MAFHSTPHANQPALKFTIRNIFPLLILFVIFCESCRSAPANKFGPEKWKSSFDARYPRAKFSETAPDPPESRVDSVDTWARRNTVEKRATSSSAVKFPDEDSSGQAPPAAGIKVLEDLAKNFTLGNATAIDHAVSGFIRSAENTLRGVLISTQSGLLRMVGLADQGLDRFQKRLQNTTFQLTLAGQKTAAQVYEALPPFVNTLIQRLGTPSGGRSPQQFSAQVNEAVSNLRQLRKQFFDAWDEHELDFHNVFQDRFTQINQYLRVPELPRRAFGWY